MSRMQLIKRKKSIVIAVFAMASITAQAQIAGSSQPTNELKWVSDDGAMSTNILTADLTSTNAAAKNYGKYDLTIGFDGFTAQRTGKSAYELDVSLSSNPFKNLNNLWIGIDQSISWEPVFGGSTDFTIYWPFDVYKDTIYLNPGISGGIVYGNEASSYLRAGPIVELQYYVTDSAFIYCDLNYDAITTGVGAKGLRPSVGVGIEF